MLVERIKSGSYCVNSGGELLVGRWEENGVGEEGGTREMYLLGRGSRLWRAC